MFVTDRHKCLSENSRQHQCFSEKFPKVRAIADCLEVFTEVPSTLTHTNARFSTYKNHTTVKCLVAIAPGGWFSFVSVSVLVKLTIGKWY